MVLEHTLSLLAAGFAAALVLEWLTLLASRRLALLAMPTSRSSHVQPTPTGGGIAFVVPVAAYLAWVGAGQVAEAAVLAAGGAVLALVGLVDDRREVSARLRLVLHTAVAAAFVWFALPEAGAAMMLAVILALVWQINLYNFMDGIDGLAGAQAVVYLVGVQVVAPLVPGWTGDVSWLGSAAMVGFLVFNWPPARIFMGDVGSGFLGLLTGAFAVLLWQQGVVPLTSSLILLAGFWFDATYTLIVRALTGQPFTQAHRSHLYQKLAATRGHLWTTVCFLLFSAVWLVPLSWLCARYSGNFLLDLTWLALAVAPVAVAARRWRAGLKDG